MKQKLLKSLLMIVCLLFGVGTTWAADATLTFSEQGYANAQQVSSGAIDSFTSWSATDGGTSTAYYTTGTGLRVYNGGTFKISSTKTIASITLTFSGTGYTFSTSNTTTPQTVTPNATSYSWDVSRTCRLQKIEVTYAGGGSTPTKYTVTVANNIANGTVSASSTSAAAGTEVTLTATPSTGYEFGSWSVTNASTSGAITVTNNKFTMPAANVNVSATFNAIQGGGEPSGDGTKVTWIASEQGYSDGTQYTSATVDENISLAFGDGGNDGKYYNTGTAIRIYANGKVTVSAKKGYSISNIVFTYSGTGNTGTFSASTGSYSLSSSTGTWTGPASSVVFTNTASSGHARIQKIAVTYEEDDTPAGDPQISNFIKTATLILEKDAANYDVRNCLNIPDDYPEGTVGAYNITTTIDNLTQKDHEFACVYPYLSFQKSGTYSVTVTAAAVAGKYAETTGTITVTVPEVYASLEDLVDANITSGTPVTVSFEDVAIKSIYTTDGGSRNGIFFDIQKGENDIEIYYQNVPAAWVVGGTLSGKMTCPWKIYNGTWELAPTSGTWSWTNLTYNAPDNYAPAITTQPVSASYEYNEVAKNLTVVATGNPAPTYQWYSNATNSNENGTELDGETNASYKPSTATAGTFYYYCVATNSKGSATSDVATITVKEPVLAALPFAFDGGVSDIASKDGMSQSGLGSDYSSSPKLKFDTQGDNVIINFNEAAKKVTYTIKGNGTSGTYAFDVMESADGVEYTTVHSHTSITDATSYTDNLKADSRFVKFVYTTKANGNVALGKISIIAASYREEPNLAFDKASYKFIAGKDMQVAATSKAGSTGAITYALTEGDEDAFLIDENTGEVVCETAGTYTVTATIAETADYYSRSTTCTVNVVEPIVGNSIIVAQTDGGYYAMTTTCMGSYYGHKAIKKVGEKYVVSSLDDILFYTNTVDGQTTIQSTSNNEYVQATAAKSVSYTGDEYKWSNDGEKLTAETSSYGTLQYNTSSPRFTTYEKKTGQYATIVDLANVVVGDVVTLNAACTDGDFVYGTYSNTSAWVVPEDLVVSEVCVLDGELAIYSYDEGDVVPAGAGVMVAAEEGGNYIVEFTTDAASASPSGENSLIGTGNGITAAEMTQADTEFFRLTMHNGTKIGFWWGAENGAAFDLGANKAYLAVSTGNLGLGAGSNMRGLWFDDSYTTSIGSVQSTNAQAIYDLQGRRVLNAKNGMYIVNGRKVIR